MLDAAERVLNADAHVAVAVVVRFASAAGRCVDAGRVILGRDEGSAASLVAAANAIASLLPSGVFPLSIKRKQPAHTRESKRTMMSKCDLSAPLLHLLITSPPRSPSRSMTAMKKIACIFLYVLYTRRSSTGSFGRCSSMYVASTAPMQFANSGGPVGAALHACCSATVHQRTAHAAGTQSIGHTEQ